MKTFLLVVLTLVCAIVVVCAFFATLGPPMPRRRFGRCAVPGCRGAAGHWRARR